MNENRLGQLPLSKGARGLPRRIAGGFFERRIFNEYPNPTYGRFICLWQDFPLQKTIINRISSAAMGHEGVATQYPFLGGAEAE